MTTEKKAGQKMTHLEVIKLVKELAEQVEKLSKQVESFENMFTVAEKPLQKTEKHDGQVPTARQERNMEMNRDMKIVSIQNAIKILPPNLVDKNGRHSAANIGAICGFKITPDLYLEAYK